MTRAADVLELPWELRRTDVDALGALNDAYLESVRMGDVDRFREILADDFLCSAADGSVLDKAQFLDLTAGPRTPFQASSFGTSVCLR